MSVKIEAKLVEAVDAANIFYEKITDEKKDKPTNFLPIDITLLAIILHIFPKIYSQESNELKTKELMITLEKRIKNIKITKNNLETLKSNLEENKEQAIELIIFDANFFRYLLIIIDLLIKKYS